MTRSAIINGNAELEAIEWEPVEIEQPEAITDTDYRPVTELKDNEK